MLYTLLSTLVFIASCGQPATQESQTPPPSEAAIQAQTSAAVVFGPAERSSQLSASVWWRAYRTEAIGNASPNAVVDTLAIGLDLLMSRAQVAVRGVVRSVDGPYWNQADGQFWPRHEDDYTAQSIYREVTIDVTDVLWDELGDARIGQPFQFIALGDGNGDSPSGGDLPGDGAIYAVGDEVIVLLEWKVFNFRETGADVYQVAEPPWGVFNPNPDGTFSAQAWTDDPQRRLPKTDPRLAFLFEGGAWTIDELEAAIATAKTLEIPPDFQRQYPSALKAEITNQRNDVGLIPSCLNTPKGMCR